LHGNAARATRVIEQVSLRFEQVAMAAYLALPDDWTPAEKAAYCRAQSAQLQQRAEQAQADWLREEYLGVARHWLALERFHVAEDTRLREAPPPQPIKERASRERALSHPQQRWVRTG
jgi:hypothetical protein